jgi:hypothetical protein
MKKSPIIFFIILIFSTVFLIWVIYYQEQNNIVTISDKPQENLENQNQQSQADLVNRYKKNLEKTFNDFLAQNKLVVDPNLSNQSLLQLEQDIMNLIVPAEYKELHLNIIIAINKLKSLDPEEIKQGQFILDEQINLYHWLSPFLSLFVVNYY